MATPLTSDELNDRLRALATEPQQVSGDQGQFTNHSLRDQILLDEYTRKQTAANSGATRNFAKSVLRGLRIAPPSGRGR